MNSTKTVKAHMQNIAHLGGKALLKKRGRAFYSQIAKKRWAKKKIKSK